MLFLVVLSLFATVRCEYADLNERCHNDRKDRVRVFHQWQCRSFLHNSGCPTHGLWLQRMQELDPNPNKVFINIGFNKGYNFAEWAALWAPSAGITPKSWKENGEPLFCGVCNDCLEQLNPQGIPSSATVNSKLLMYGIDLNELNIKKGNAIIDKFSQSTDWKGQVKLELVHAAAGNVTDYLWVMRCKEGDESCAIIPSSLYAKYGIPLNDASVSEKDHALRIPIVSVDNFMQEHSSDFTKIDILMTDTEGNDPMVIQGAIRSLEKGLVRCYLFEYHKAGMWRDLDLRTVLQPFEKYEYECYLEGHDYLYPLSGDCWEDRFAFKRWSNVICVKKGDVWIEALRKYSVFNQDTITTHIWKIPPLAKCARSPVKE